MNFFILVSAVFSCGALLLSAGFQQDVVTLMVFLAVCIAAEIHKPEEGTIRAFRWMTENLKWVCLPALAFYL